MIKEEIEKECPGVVSCADIIVLSVRDSIVMSGGPFYPISTGRRDSTRAFQEKAEAEIPRPMSNVSEVLRLFSLRGFDERETTALLGAHNIGHIGCQFLAPRFSEFSSSPDPSMDPSFFEELRQKCISNATSIPNRLVPIRTSRHLSHSSKLRGSATHSQELISGEQSFSSFDGHYFRSLVAGKGILFSDQQLMSFEKTVKIVQEYASDDTKFRLDFARAMLKLSNLGVLTGSQGQIRRNCSIPVNG
ncbi:hypothetical protein Leryth_010187 [Lithospermum erythrorhizon]|uniref:peroxidase n=1 Tax=Lithospermum erythrorhizon TaxID=34254 RepID=A0AAV3P3I6_LITER|nr:hypothetical protein Leryth_010187 [Lithospermum erythrorhizon]